MDSDTGRNCPRCGAALKLRLQEYDCLRCGYFMPVPKPEPVPAAAEAADGPAAPATTAPAPKAAHSKALFTPELLLDTPQPPPSRLIAPRQSDVEAYDRRLSIEKAVFCAVAAIVLITGNLLVLRGQSQLGGSGAAASMVIGGLIYAAIAAVLLYIDWGIVKRYSIYFFLVTMFFVGYACYSFYTDKHPAMAYKLAADFALLGWMVSLLYRDCNRYE
jgi:hypothetical protein